MTLRVLYTKDTSVKRFQITINGLSDGDEKLLVEYLKIVTSTALVTHYNLFHYEPFIEVLQDLVIPMADKYPALRGFQKVQKELGSYSIIVVLGDCVPTLYEDFYRKALIGVARGEDYYECWHKNYIGFGIGKNAIWDRYETFLFTDYGDKVIIGERDIAKRKCRFCGATNPLQNTKEGIITSHFQNISHAISRSLGNQKIICNEECDDCNNDFSNGIENDINQFFSISQALHSKKSYNGKPKSASGENFLIAENQVQVQLPSNFTNFSATMTVHPSESGFTCALKDNVGYVPANVYRCLVKFVISCIDVKYLPVFPVTKKWIRRKKKFLSLPKVYLNENTPYTDTPILMLFLRKDNNTDLPYCVAMLSVYDRVLVYAVPFCSPHEIDNKDLNKPMAHFVEMYMSNENLTGIDLSSEKKELSDSLLTIRKNSPNQLTLVCDGKDDSPAG